MNMHVTAIKRFVQHCVSAYAGIPILIYLGFICLLFLMLDTNSIPMQTIPGEKGKTHAPLSQEKLSEILQWPLFGQDHALQTMTDGNLQLIGIILEDDESVAIIRVNGEDQFLKVGSKINDRYSINRIEQMRVVVTSDDGLEQLELFQNMDNNKQRKEKADGGS